MVLTELVRCALELDEPPDSELVPVILGGRPLEVIERRLVVTAIIKDVREVDARLGVLTVRLKRATQRCDGGLVVAQTMLRVAHAGDGFRTIGCLLRGDFEELE